MMTFQSLSFTCNSISYRCEQQPLIMGILNVTPDSFSDGNTHFSTDLAIQHALKMQQDGANIIDLGGESTRPGAQIVPPEVEQQRILPVLKELKQALSIPVSIDTRNAETAAKAIELGADIINDVSAMEWDPEMKTVLSGSKVGIILMHSLGNPKTMDLLTSYQQDIVDELINWQYRKLEECAQVNIDIQRLVFDPGIGFAKTTEQSIKLIQHLSQLRQHARRPILLGPSRKRIIGELLNISHPNDRVFGTIGACIAGMQNGADILRVHDVAPVTQACKMAKFCFA